MSEATVEEVQETVRALTNAFNSFAADTNQTIADLELKANQGGIITAADLGPIKDSLTALSSSVEAADATVKGADPGKEPVTVTSPQSVYLHPAGSFEGPEWPVAPFLTAEEFTTPEGTVVPVGSAVYDFAGDTVGDEPPTTNGVGHEGWFLYTGALTAVPAAE